MEILGKGAVVTGGASGIGRGIVLALAAAGANVIVADIDVGRAEEVAKEVEALGRRAAFFKCDVSKEASLVDLADFAWSTLGSIELLFNNAGVVVVGPAISGSVHDLNWTLNVNVFGVWNGSVVFARRFLERGVQGWICNTGSENSLGAASIGTAIYTGTKHAILGLTDSLRSELKGKIGFSIVCPGIVSTSLWNSGRHRPEDLGGEFNGDPLSEKAMSYGIDPERVGQHIVQCVKNEEFYIFTHRHVRDIAEARWNEVAAAMDRQWPADAESQGPTTIEIQKKIMEEFGLTG